MITLLSACVSNDLNNNLDTKVVASQNIIKFSWDEAHPFANEYQNSTILLVAEYLEQNNHGNIRPVSQILARSNLNTYNILGSKTFSLPLTLRSVPVENNICLYLQVNNKAVPVRAAGRGDTARFSYPSWSKQISHLTKQEFNQQNMRQAEQNLAAINNAINKLNRAKKERIAEFNRQLLDTTKTSVQVNERADCDNIYLQAGIIEKPYGVVEQDEILQTAQRNCMYKSYRGIEIVSKYKKLGYVSVLPIIILSRDKFKLDTASLNSKEQKGLANFSKMFTAHYPYIKSGSNFKPHYGDQSINDQNIKVSEFSSELARKSISSILSGKKLNETQKKSISKRIGVELVAVEQCIAEGVNQLTTKRKAWELQNKAMPERVKARQNFVVNQCHNMFEEGNYDLAKLEQQQIKATDTLAAIQVSNKDQSQPVSTSTNEIELNQQVCSLGI